MSEQQTKQKVLRKRKYHKRAFGYDPSDLYIPPQDSDNDADTDGSESSQRDSRTNKSTSSESDSSATTSGSSSVRTVQERRVPVRYSPRFRRLFSTKSSSSENERLLSTTTSSCSSLPDLLIEPAEKKRKFEGDLEDYSVRKLMFASEKIREKCIEKDWKTNYTKFRKKYFVLSYCKIDRHESNVRKFCNTCTIKAEDDVIERLKKQRENRSRKTRGKPYSE